MTNRSLLPPILRALSLAAVVCSASAALAVAEPLTGPRETIPFDAGWRFHLGDDPAARQPNFDDTSWRTLDLPHDWSIEGPIARPPEGEGNGGFFTHGIGWYRKSFTLPASTTDGKKVVIEFDGVYMNSEVWINGQFLGRRPYGFMGFRYDLTAFLKANGTNVLAVRVDDSLEPALRWYAGSGIYRHVRLLTTSFATFRLNGGITITTPEITPDQATVEVKAIIDGHFFTDAERQATIRNSWNVKPTNHEVVLRNSVFAPDGSVAASTESKLTLSSLQPGQSATQRVMVPKPSLWSETTPVLYRLRSTLTLDGRALDETTTTFGIRKLEFDPDRGLLVNGKPTKLKGVCVHQDAGSFGNAVPAAIWAMRLGLLKELGCNAVRTSHHPFAPEFYDLCDQLGIYVFDEAFDEWTRDWAYNYTEDPRGKSKYGYHLYFNEWHETDLRDMLRRDRNHPSIVLWSIGNEIPNQLDRDGYKMAQQLVAICHEEDPTRPATSACDQSATSSRNGFMDALDIAGYNYIDRLYGTNTYAPERVRFPRRLCLGTETSSSLPNWLGVRDHDYVIGEFIWTGIDYLGETGSLPNRGNGSGFIDIATGKKSGFYQRAAYWRTDPVLQILASTAQAPAAAGAARGGRGGRAGGGGRGGASLPSWNWPAGAQLAVRVTANCDEVELFLNDASLGRHKVSQDIYSSDWTVTYAPGTISAVGYRAGQQVTTQKLRTTGPAAKLAITPVKLPVPSDMALYEITAVDEAGLNVLDATQDVTVRVQGPGRLIGLDTADLTYGGQFKTDTRRIYQGRILATVQRTAPTGDIRLTATAQGLASAEK
jgi:beta-galactosidase